MSLLTVILLAPIGYSQSSKLPDLKPYFVAIIVRNIDTSSQWYSEVLGFEILNRVNMEERGFRQANLKRGTATIELIEIDTAIYPLDILKGKAKRTQIAGYFKIGFSVSDFDKWENWNRDIKDMILDCNVALLDGSFYDGTELPHRDMNEIPHPFIVESLESFKTMQYPDKQKIHFIHFNHTNPLLNKNDPKYKKLIDDGYNIAAEGQILKL
ncbi:MAG: VOC family protein [Bacteroidetes bacterium]|nr:VOC family protein [Bacteroidota bacterium]